MNELIYQCSKTIAWNAEHLLTSPEWEHMDIDFVSDLLKNGDLVIQNEFKLFKALIRWLESDEHLEHFVDNAKELLPLIRFPQMQVFVSLGFFFNYIHDWCSVVLLFLFFSGWFFFSF